MAADVYPRRVVSALTAPSRQAYRIASWVSAGLAFVAAVLTFAFGLAAVVGPAPPEEEERVTAGPAPTGPAGEVLATDQIVVSGMVTRVVGTQVEAPPLIVPLTMTVVQKGGGTKADFSGGAVAGKNATLSWDGGRPLPLRGQGSMDLNGPVDVEINPDGASWKLDGASRLLTPGSYTFGATVAVSPLNGGLGAPKENAKLDIPAGAAASVLTDGDVRVATKAAPLRLRGPGGLVLEGTLEVRSRDSVRQAGKITFGPGAFELDLEPVPGGYRVDGALLQGPMTVDG